MQLFLRMLFSSLLLVGAFSMFWVCCPGRRLRQRAGNLPEGRLRDAEKSSLSIADVSIDAMKILICGDGAMRQDGRMALFWPGDQQRTGSYLAELLMKTEYSQYLQTNFQKTLAIQVGVCYIYRHGSIAQLVRALRSHRRGRGFESPCFYHPWLTKKMSCG